MKHRRVLPIFLGVCVFGFVSVGWAQPDSLAQNAPQDSHLVHSKTAVNSRKLPKDQLAELGVEDQLKLQQQMDRRSKMQQSMSNMMKKESDTSSSVSGNLK